MKHNIDILFEDDIMIAVNKQAGVLTIPDRFNPDLPNLVSILKKQYPDLIPVHRIDKFTSGVNLFAKDAESHKLLSEIFESRDIEKYYLAVVVGKPANQTIDAPLFK